MTLAALLLLTGKVRGAEDASPQGEAAEPVKKLVTPRDWFTHYGIDESHFRKFLPGEPLSDDEVEPLLKVLYRMREFQPRQLEGWASSNTTLPLDEFAADPSKHQGEVYLVRGRAKRLEAIEPWPEMAERFEMPQYYRCEFELLDGAPAVVFAVAVPKAWKDEAKRNEGRLDARAGALAAFVKPMGRGDAPTPVFAAARIAWYPDTPLGNLGLDYGLFDAVERRKPPESEPFYQLLAAVGRTKPGELQKEADAALGQMARQREAEPKSPSAPTENELIRDPLRQDDQRQWHYSVIPLFRDPDAQHGRLVSLFGKARQVQKVIVDDPEIRRRFKIDHYYQVGVFTEDSGINPVFFCVLDLPEGMPLGDTERYGESVRVAGFFMKLWSYRINVPEGWEDERGKSGRLPQPAPLLVARDLTWYPAPPAPTRNTLAAFIAVGFLVAAVVVAWIAMSRMYRGKDYILAKTQADRIVVPEQEQDER